jgi:hypothetical protein
MFKEEKDIFDKRKCMHYDRERERESMGGRKFRPTVNQNLSCQTIKRPHILAP